MAKSGTARKKTAAKKRMTRAGKKSTSRKTAASKTAKKAPASKKRKMTKKKSTSKKKVTKRVAKKSTGKSASKTSKKKTATKKKKASTSKKKTTKKSLTKKKATTKKKTRTKKSASKSAAKAVSSKTAATGEAGAEAAPKKKTKKRLSAADSRKRGRSVAEVASAAAADAQGYVFINGRRVRMISTAGLAPLKKSKAAVVPESVEEVIPIKSLKTKLTKKQLNHYRDLLLIKRAEIVGDLSAMEAAALRSSGGEISHMPIHMADIGSDTYEQDFTLGLAESERRQLREIDDALSRIEDRTYGVCQMTGKDIPKARLDAKPWAKYTIEAARVVESQMQR